MTVNDILSVLRDTTNVQIIKDGMILARYDGRNSIDPLYNKCKVKSIYSPNRIFTLCIEIEE